MMLRTFASLSISFALFACSSEVTDQDTSSAGAAVVSDSTFRTAFEITSAIDYLPYDYKVDGCFARAFYVSMELASQGIASNQLFAIAKPGAPLRSGRVMWGFHVAPMLEVELDAKTKVHRVLDPALAKTALTDQEWLGLMRTQPDTDATRPRLMFVPGSKYAPTPANAEALEHTSFANVDVSDFTHLPPFAESDIQMACEVMHLFLYDETAMAAKMSPTAVCVDGACIEPAKEQKLLTRSTELVALLRGKGKLKSDAPFSAAKCKLRKH